MENHIHSLFITYDGLTDPLGLSQILPYIIKLAENSYKIHIISFEKKENYTLQKNHVKKMIHNKAIIWHPLMYTKKPPVLSTVYDILRLIKKTNKLHKQYHFRLVHCRSYISSFAGMMMKKKIPYSFYL